MYAVLWRVYHLAPSVEYTYCNFYSPQSPPSTVRWPSLVHAPHERTESAQSLYHLPQIGNLKNIEIQISNSVPHAQFLVYIDHVWLSLYPTLLWLHLSGENCHSSSPPPSPILLFFLFCPLSIYSSFSCYYLSSPSSSSSFPPTLYYYISLLPDHCDWPAMPRVFR